MPDAPRCGARTRAGGRCRQPAMANGRCRYHGGLSTGPRTPEGRERVRRAVTRHGRRTKEAEAAAHARGELARELRELLRMADATRGAVREAFEGAGEPPE